MKGRSLLLSILFAFIAVSILITWMYGGLSAEYRMACLVGIVTCCAMTLALLRLARVNQHQYELSERYRQLAQRYEERNLHLRDINDALHHEIARHEITEELLQETQDYLHGIINSMPSVIIGVTQDGMVTLWNDGARRAFGLRPEDILGLPLFEIFPQLPANLQMIQQAIDSGQAQVTENVRKGEGSSATYMDVAVYPAVQDEFGGAVIRLDDITMRVRLENMMIQNEKMLSLGELAAGMAHEINNPLSAVMQGAQNIRRRLSTDLNKNHQVAEDVGVDIAGIEQYMQQRDVGKLLDTVQNAGQRAAKIVSNMLEFSRSNSVQQGLVDLNELVEHSLDLAISTFDIPATISKQRIRIEKDLSNLSLKVMCSGAEIQQVLLNLLRNASQAMSAEGCVEPLIKISTQQKNDRAIITVSDNGPGMSEEVRQHIFEPFYTTKATSKGTGLGLSVSYFIVTEHHEGTIEVSSEEGKGSCFTISLPFEQEYKDQKVKDSQAHMAVLEKAEITSAGLYS